MVKRGVTGQFQRASEGGGGFGGRRGLQRAARASEGGGGFGGRRGRSSVYAVFDFYPFKLSDHGVAENENA